VRRSAKRVQPSRKALRIKRSAKQSVAKTREDLAVELYSLVGLALRHFGVTTTQQRRAIERSRHLKSAPRISGPLLRDMRALSAIILEWTREPDYLDADGKPRVLAIAGPGATFETLARRFLPRIPLEDVVSMACETAEVVTRPMKRIALLGSILVKIVKSKDRYLAHAVRQIDQLLETILYNQRIHREGFKHGRMERMVSGVISRRKFKRFMAELRPQLYDVMLGVDTCVQRHQPKSVRALRDATAVSVGVYVSEEDDLQRAGLDASFLVRPKRQEPKARKRTPKRVR